MNQSNNVFHKNVLIEKYRPGKTLFVVINKATFGTYWYAKHINEIFLVREFSSIADCKQQLSLSTYGNLDIDDIIKNKFIVLGDKLEASGAIIHKDDCDVIK